LVSSRENPDAECASIGLSRQLTLERQMDVVANNVANINTPASRPTLAVPGIPDASRTKTTSSAATAASPSSRTRYLPRFHTAVRETKNPLDVAIAGTGFLVVQTPAGSATPRRLDADQQSGSAVTTSGNPCSHQRPIVFSRPTMTSACADATSACSKRQRIDSVRASCGWSVSRRRSASEGSSNLFSAGEGNARSPTITSKVNQGFVERSNVNSVVEDEPNDRGHTHLHPDLGDAAAARRPTEIRPRQAAEVPRKASFG